MIPVRQGVCKLDVSGIISFSLHIKPSSPLPFHFRSSSLNTRESTTRLAGMCFIYCEFGGICQHHHTLVFQCSPFLSRFLSACWLREHHAEITGSCALCTGESDSILEEAARLMWYRRQARRRGWYYERGGKKDEERGASEDGRNDVLWYVEDRYGDWLGFGEKDVAMGEVDVEDE